MRLSRASCSLASMLLFSSTELSSTGDLVCLTSLMGLTGFGDVEAWNKEVQVVGKIPFLNLNAKQTCPDFSVTFFFLSA